tara:strand:+ start:251 stop:379 length:129 start_codon:yes stop_codon:yes gene_type:complete
MARKKWKKMGILPLGQVISGSFILWIIKRIIIRAKYNTPKYI